MKKAFSMIELIFVIVILGILAGIAIPKLFVNRDDAVILKAKDEIANIKANIESYAQSELYSKGKKKYPDISVIAPKLGVDWKNSGNILIYKNKYEFSYDKTKGVIKCIKNCRGLE